MFNFFAMRNKALSEGKQSSFNLKIEMYEGVAAKINVKTLLVKVISSNKQIVMSNNSCI